MSGCSAQTQTAAVTPPALPPSVAGDVMWAGGQSAPPPRGKLLSDNLGYYGETVPTGVRYKYPVTLNKQMDNLRADKSNFGRRLLNGEIEGNDAYVPVSMENASLVVEFDFRQPCTFTEIDVADTRDKSVSLSVQTRAGDETADWVPGPKLDQSVGKIHRLCFEPPVTARYVRLTASSGAAVTAIDEVWAWGDAKPSMEPEHGLLPEMRAAPEMKDTVPGDATVLAGPQVAAWRGATGYMKDGVTWQVAASPWQMLHREPLKTAFLPGEEGLQKPVVIVAARNEGEPAALFLVNASDKPRDVTVSLAAFQKSNGTAENTIDGKLSVAGAIWTKRWGQTLRPLFSSGNLPGGALLEKYLTNGSTIKDFPALHLPAGGTAMLWLTVHTNNTAPGKYQSFIVYGETRIPVQVDVAPVMLPYPNVWTYQWNEVSQMLPFRNADAMQKEVKYMQQDLGITAWSQLPRPGTDAAMARGLEKGYNGGRRMTYYRFRPAVYETNLGYMGKLEGVTYDPAFRANIERQVNAAVSQAKALGLGYDEFAFELWDEPWAKSLRSFATMVKLIKEIDPRVRIVANPLFWGSKGSSPDSEQVKYLEGWYNENIDVSIPVLPNLNANLFPRANREFYDHPRFVRAMYIHPCPGRLISWEAFKRGYNGWGFYAYYRPRGDAWNDFDTSEFDYQIVYPGPHGAVPTIESEAMRESWDDYRLLTLLKQQNQTELVQQLMDRFEKEVPVSSDTQDWRDVMQRGVLANKVLPELRAIALKAAVKP